MRHAVTAVLTLFWLVLGYSVLLWVARRFLIGRYRAQVATIAVLVAFSAGAALRRTLPSAAAVPAPVAPATVPPPTALALSTRDVSAEVGKICESARLSLPGGNGNVDGATVRAGASVLPIASRGALRGGDILVVSGWAAAPELKTPSHAVCLVVDGRILSGIRVVYGENRPDVARAFNLVALEPTGFEARIPAARLGAGPHTIQAAAVVGDGSAGLIPGEVRLAGSPDRSPPLMQPTH